VEALATLVVNKNRGVLQVASGARSVLRVSAVRPPCRTSPILTGAT